MSVTTLAGTKWYFNSTLDFTALPTNTYYVTFESRTSYSYMVQNNSTLYYGEQVVYDSSWGDTGWRTIEFTGGTDATNSTLIAWLESNATIASSVVNDIDGCTLSPTEAFAGTAYTGTLTADSTHTVPSTVYVNGTAYTVTSNQFTVPASAVTGSFHVTGTSASIKDVQLKDGSDLLLPVTKVRNIQDLTATAAELNIMDGVTATASQLNTLAGMSSATSGQFFVANGSGGASWVTVPNANTESF